MSIAAREFDVSRIKTPKQAYRNVTCPLYTAAKILGKRWTLNLLQDLFAGGGSRRFNEIRKSLDWIAPKVLSQRLKELTNFEIIDRNVNTESSPVRVTYSLTEKGWGLESVLACLKEWGMKFVNQEIAHCADVICMSCEPNSETD